MFLTNQLLISTVVIMSSYVPCPSLRTDQTKPLASFPKTATIPLADRLLKRERELEDPVIHHASTESSAYQT
ncbi:hypothetical protein BC941DRAFT_421120, partial [Chlamydoabsidia padenii]